MAEVFEVYGRTHCQWCDAVKDLLTDNNKQFVFRNIETDSSAREDFIKKFPGAKTVPQVSLNGKWLGGYEDTREHIYGYN
jgi:glutaredoxin